MKVLHLLQSTRFSGAENVVCQIIGMMKNEPNIEMVYCSPDGQIREALKERGVTFEAIKELSVKEVKQIIKKFNPDIIHAHDRSACIIAALASKKIPVVAHIHVNNNKGMSAFVKNAVLTLFAKKYRHIFWVSDSAYDQFQFKRIVSKKSSVLYNVLDTEALYKKCEQDEALYNYDVVYVGRLSHQKNPERLIKVLHELVKLKNEVKIAIVGSGEFSEYITKYISDNNLEKNIDYFGYKNNPLKLISDSKVMIMTSYFEGTPMVALEAQCFGTPIVSTPVDGMKKIVTNGYNGYLADNDEDLLYLLMQVITDSELRAKLKDNSLSRSKEYNDINKFSKAIKDAYYLSEGNK